MEDYLQLQQGSNVSHGANASFPSNGTLPMSNQQRPFFYDYNGYGMAATAAAATTTVQKTALTSPQQIGMSLRILGNRCRAVASKIGKTSAVKDELAN